MNTRKAEQVRQAVFGVLAAVVFSSASAQQGNNISDQLEIRQSASMPMQAHWLGTTPGDLAAQALIGSDVKIPDSRHVETDAVHFAWPLSAVSAATETDATARVESRQYWFDTKGSALAQGISLPLTSRNAVIRISPLEADGNVRIDARSVELSVDGRPLDADRALRSVADGESLNRQGMPVPPSTLAFRLGDEVPPGVLGLRVQRVPGSQPMVVHVFEPESEWVAELSRSGHNAMAGELLEFDFALKQGARAAAVDSVQAVLTDPLAGQSWKLDVDAGAGRLTHPAPADGFVSGFDGLYEAHVYLETRQQGLIIRRDLKLPVSVVPPLARFDGRSAVLSDDSGLRLTLGVENAAPGRFQVNAQVFGTDVDGNLQPLAFAQAAETLEQSFGTISLQIGADLLGASGLSAPFEVRNLELLDQGRMYVLQRHQRALLISR